MVKEKLCNLVRSSGAITAQVYSSAHSYSPSLQKDGALVLFPKSMQRAVGDRLLWQEHVVSVGSPSQLQASFKFAVLSGSRAGVVCCFGHYLLGCKWRKTLCNEMGKHIYIRL